MGGSAVNGELEYKGYTGSVEYSSEDRLLFGKVLFVDSLLLYYGQSVDELEKAFRETVDAYLLHCEATGKSPNKPYSGTFNVRVGAERHRAAAQLSYRKRISLNELMSQALDAFLQFGASPVVINNSYHLTEGATDKQQKRVIFGEETSVEFDSELVATNYGFGTWQNNTEPQPRH